MPTSSSICSSVTAPVCVLVVRLVVLVRVRSLHLLCQSWSPKDAMSSLHRNLWPWWISHVTSSPHATSTERPPSKRPTSIDSPPTPSIDPSVCISVAFGTARSIKLAANTRPLFLVHAILTVQHGTPYGCIRDTIPCQQPRIHGAPADRC